MIEKVVTGGESGVEQAAWLAARRAGVATGGYMPRGYATEDGPAPRVGALHDAIEFPLSEAQRLRANLRRVDALLWFGDPLSGEAKAVFEACRELGKPFTSAQPGSTAVSDVVSWLVVFEVKSLMVSGSPPSRAPGLAPRAAAFMDLLLPAVRAATSGRR
jgi:hypothetical protein